MGIWFVGSIKVRAFSQQALDRVRNLDLDKRFNLPGDFSARGDQLYYKENLNGIFDPEDIVYDFRDILNGEGIVSSTYECGEDGEIAYTYYWLGDGIKVVNFSGCGGVHDIYFDDDEDYDEDDDEYHVDEIYSHAARHAALLHFGIDELRALYDEITEDYEGFEEYVPDDELITALNRYMDANDNEDWACFFDTPHAKKLLEQIKINRGKCRFEDHDFEPNIGWEEKGYVKFTDIEKAYLNANTMEELKSALDRIKKTEKKTKTETQKISKEKESVSEMNDIPLTAQQYGENVWHSVGDGDHEFRMFGFKGNGTPVYVEIRNIWTNRITGSGKYIPYLPNVKPESGIRVTTDYVVKDIDVWPGDHFKCKWIVNLEYSGGRKEGSFDLTFSLKEIKQLEQKQEAAAGAVSSDEPETEEIEENEEAEDIEETEEEFGDDIWHPVGDDAHEFRIYGFEGYGTPVYIDVRDAVTEEVSSTERYEIDFGDYKPEEGYEIVTDYIVKDIELLTDDQFRFDWYVSVLEDDVEAERLYTTLEIDIYPAEEDKESEENEESEKSGEEEPAVEDYSEKDVNERVREEFKRQISEKQSELENLSLREEKIREEIRLLEEMLEKI